MANRSYLYAVASNKNSHENNLYCIATNAYSISLLFKCLLSINTEKVDSGNYFTNDETNENIISYMLRSDFYESKKKFENVFDSLILPLDDNDEFYKNLKADYRNLRTEICALDGEDENSKTIRINKKLINDNISGINMNYFMLDPSEIYSLSDVDKIAKIQTMLFDDIGNIDRCVEVAKNKFIEYENLKNQYPIHGLFSSSKNKKLLEEIEHQKNNIYEYLGIYELDSNYFQPEIIEFKNENNTIKMSYQNVEK